MPDRTLPMAPPNNESKPMPKVAVMPASKLTTTGPAVSVPCIFSQQDSIAALLMGVPGNGTLTSFTDVFDPKTSDVPPEMVEQAAVNARQGAFLGSLCRWPPTARVVTRGEATGAEEVPERVPVQDVVEHGVGGAARGGRDLQMETLVVLLEVPELAGAGYVLVLPLA